MKPRYLSLLLTFATASLVATAQTTSPSATELARQVDPATELATARKDLGEMLKRYTEKHPSVIKQRQKIKQLEKTIGTRQTSAPSSATK